MLNDFLYSAAAFGLSKIFDGEIDKVQKFFHDLEATEAPTSTISFKSLVKIMARVRKLDVCKNCQATPCLDGKKLTKENIVPGATISQLRGKSGKIVKLVPISKHDHLHLVGAVTSYVFHCKIV